MRKTEAVFVSWDWVTPADARRLIELRRDELADEREDFERAMEAKEKSLELLIEGLQATVAQPP